MIIYLDFDGVLFDTVSIILNLVKENNVDLKGDCKFFFENLNWHDILIKSKEINNSIKTVNDLKSVYNLKILTHVSSINEMEEKINFINDNFKDIEIIFVPKKCSKSSIVNSNNNVLIDDSKKNIEDWIDHGGIGYFFDGNNIEEIIKELII